MAIEYIHTYLVHPGKGADDAPRIGGTSVPLNGKLFRLLDNIYTSSDDELDIEISFNQGAGGIQQNDCRDLITAYLHGPTLPRGRRIAERLQSVTDRRSGLGLLFLMAGREGKDDKLVISRFPTDSAILAEEDQNNLTVELLERVFMKSASTYKAAAYQDASLTAEFWLGRAIDRQINSRTVQVSDYWISDFLASGFRLTSAAGTRRLGVVLRNAAKKSADIAVKSEIAAAVTLAGNLGGQRTSIQEFADRFGLSKPARDAIQRELKNPRLADERFRFDANEFQSQVGYRSIELDNGAVLTSQSSEFDEVFQQEVLDDVTQEVRFSTEGRIVSEKLRKAQQ